MAQWKITHFWRQMQQTPLSSGSRACGRTVADFFQRRTEATCTMASKSTRGARGSSKSEKLENLEHSQSSTNNNLVVRRKSKATEKDDKTTVKQQQQSNKSSLPRSGPQTNSSLKQVCP